MLSTLVIVALLLAALAWTTAPLLRRTRGAASGEGLRRLDLESRAENRLLELRDLEFDHEMGKLAEPDFQTMRRQLVQETAGLMQQIDEEEARVERGRPSGPPLRAVRGGRSRGGGDAGAGAIVLALLLGATAPGARAQPGTAGELPPGHPPVAGDAERPLTAADTTAVSATVKITLRDGTAGGEGRAEAVSLQTIGRDGMGELGHAHDVRGAVDFPDEPIVPAAIYVIQAQTGENRPTRMVRGQDLLAGPVELVVYEATSDASGLRVANVNLVVRRVRDQLEVGWLVTVENGTQPPRAVVPGARAAFAVRVPGGPGVVTRMQSSNGMMPVPVEPAPGAEADWVAFGRALQPGPTRVDVSASLPYDGRLELPVETSADIAQLTIFAYPTDIEIKGAGLTNEGVEPQTGFLVLRAPAVRRGAPLRLAIAGGDPEAATRSPHGGMSEGGEAAQADGKVVEQKPAAARYAIYIAAAVVAAAGVVVAVRRRVPDAG